jgi:hypothetical protein
MFLCVFEQKNNINRQILVGVEWAVGHYYG